MITGGRWVGDNRREMERWGEMMEHDVTQVRKEEGDEKGTDRINEGDEWVMNMRGRR